MIDLSQIAFPTLRPRSDDASYWTEDGMSLRDYFAAHAPQQDASQLTATLAAEGLVSVVPSSERDRCIAVQLSRWAYIFADAMLAERAKPRPEK